jgi:DNA-binding MarR family transcriptional regulator
MGEAKLAEEVGIGVKQYGLMTALAGLDEAPSQQELGAMMRVDRTTMVQNVDALSERGYVVREPNPRDRRERLLALTPAGRKALDRAERIVVGFEEEFLAPLDAGEREELVRLLQKVAAARGQAPRN